MKRVVGILAVLLATTFPVLAERPQRDPQQLERLQRRLREVEDRLSLTSEQAQQVRPVVAGMLEVMRAVRDDHGVENQSRRSRRRMARELRAIRSHADERLKMVLSKEQIGQLKLMRRGWRDEFRTDRTEVASVTR